MCPVGGDDGNVNELTIAASPIGDDDGEDVKELTTAVYPHGDDDREHVIQLTAVVFTVDEISEYW